MSDESWESVLQLLRKKLRKMGRPDIADLSGYDCGEGVERRLPGEEALVSMMLAALKNELRARSSEVMNDSLERIKGIVKDGDAPEGVIVYRDTEYGKDERYDIPKNEEDVSSTISDLDKLMKKIVAQE